MHGIMTQKEGLIEMKVVKCMVSFLLSAVLLACSGCGELETDYNLTYCLSELMTVPGSAQLDMEETCTMEADFDTVNGVKVQIRQEFTVRNQGSKAEVQLILPVFFPPQLHPQPVITVDGEPWEEWRGAASRLEELESNKENEREVWEQELRDGTLFERTFPAWPEIDGELYVDAEKPDQSHAYAEGWAVGYYIKQMQLPEGGTVHVTLELSAQNVRYVRLLHPEAAIPCSSRTVSVSSVREDVFLSDEDILEKVPGKLCWEADITEPPEKEFTLEFSRDYSNDPVYPQSH